MHQLLHKHQQLTSLKISQFTDKDNRVFKNKEIIARSSAAKFSGSLGLVSIVGSKALFPIQLYNAFIQTDLNNVQANEIVSYTRMTRIITFTEGD
jgi:hypothetical protein